MFKRRGNIDINILHCKVILPTWKYLCWMVCINVKKIMRLALTAPTLN